MGKVPMSQKGPAVRMETSAQPPTTRTGHHRVTNAATWLTAGQGTTEAKMCDFFGDLWGSVPALIDSVTGNSPLIFLVSLSYRPGLSRAS